MSRAERIATDRAAFGNAAVDSSLARHHGMSLIETTIDEIIELEIRIAELRQAVVLRHARKHMPSAWHGDPALLAHVAFDDRVTRSMLADEARDHAKMLEELRAYARGLLSKSWNGADTHLCEPSPIARSA
jgi:hypothetical protein